MIGRENFDYVTMETYSADMAELSAQASGAIKSKHRDLKEAQRLIWMLVQASGGSVKIPVHVLGDYSEATAILTLEHMPHDMSLVVTTR